MKALFLTTHTNDVLSLIKAWECFNEPATHITFNYQQTINNEDITNRIKGLHPDITFYIGSCHESQSPNFNTFNKLRTQAPLIHLCCDSSDKHWWPLLQKYERYNIFDLQVGLDGAKAPIEHVTITPVDPGPWRKPLKKEFLCGFSGNMGRRSKRNSLLGPLWRSNNIVVRERKQSTSYLTHVEFLKKCQVVINTSFNGSGTGHQVKGRVVEAAWASCGILEQRESPIGHWFPSNYFAFYSSVKEAEELLRGIGKEVWEEKGKLLHQYVSEYYTPLKIYSEILEKANVDTSK